MVKVGINGLGVMGRYLIRAIEEQVKSGELKRGDVEVVAFNDLFPAEQLARLLAHDSVYLGFDGEVEADGADIIINGRRIAGYSKKEPLEIGWGHMGVDIVYESTGAFDKKQGVTGHLGAGAKKALYSAPSDFAEKTLVFGVNHMDYSGEEIVSGASCTTNCLGPLASALHKEFGIKNGLMTTIHAYTNDQKLVDAPHKDPARAYSAALNIIPTTTGAAKAIGRVIKELDSKMNGIAVRVPVPAGSLVDLVVNLEKDVSKEEVNKAVENAADTYLKGILQYREGPLVSSMVLGNPVPSIFDASQTQAIGSLVKVLSWYDNVAGYSHQAVKLIKFIGNYK